VDGAPDDADGRVSVPLDAVPDPSLRYELRDGGLLVTHTNRAFDATFGRPEAGTPLGKCLNEQQVGLDADSASAVCSSLVETGAVDMTSQSSEEGALRLRAADGPDSDGDEGLLTLEPIEPDGEDAIGVENIATVVSHDLRNPLDVAKAHLRAARERGDAEHFDRVDEAHDRMERIIEDVLTLARGDGTITPSESVDLGDVARDAWSTVDTNDASLEVSSDLPTVEADHSRLQRLFENLFRNSVEHGSTSSRSSSSHEDGAEDGAGEPSVDVRVGTTSDGGFFVADDGVGIPADDRNRVFEPGYSSSDRGAGLGLTIVERIAEAHGWAVSIPAATDGGARFEFRTSTAE
jgi:signal transduction histidine kinase